MTTTAQSSSSSSSSPTELLKSRLTTNRPTNDEVAVANNRDDLAVANGRDEVAVANGHDEDLPPIEDDDEASSASPPTTTPSQPSPDPVSEFRVSRPLSIPAQTRPNMAPTPMSASGNEFDYLFKILVVGDSAVGKTCFLFRYADDAFTPAFVSTVGIDFKVKTVVKKDKRIKLQIWDTAGQERFRSITTSYYRGALGFLVLYDVAKETSFNDIRDWMTRIQVNAWESAQIVLIGNKCDLPDAEREVSAEQGRRLADTLDVPFFEVSAKDGTNVADAFDALVDAIVLKWTKMIEEEVHRETIQRRQLLSEGAPPTWKPPGAIKLADAAKDSLPNGVATGASSGVVRPNGHYHSAKTAASCLC